MTTKNIKLKGFTIVELLIVIVVVGILAAITIVSYSGVSNRATASSNKANANGVIKAAESVYANTGSYPAESATTGTGSSPASQWYLLNGSGSASASAALPGSLANLVAGLSTATVFPASNQTTALFYKIATGTYAGKGICVFFWDSSLATPAVAALTSGQASTATWTSVSSNVCT